MPAARDAKCRGSWPGNVRELENAVQHALALGAAEIDASALPERVLKGASGVGPLPTVDASAEEEVPYGEATRRARQSFERTYLERVLARADGNISQAARLARLDRANFKRLLARHGLAGR
jgi:DNA-binding NtrC family response regulator